MPIIPSQGPSTINKTRFITIYCNNDEMIYARLDDCLEVCVVGKHWQGICRIVPGHVGPPSGPSGEEEERP